MISTHLSPSHERNAGSMGRNHRKSHGSVCLNMSLLNPQKRNFEGGSTDDARKFLDSYGFPFSPKSSVRGFLSMRWSLCLKNAILWRPGRMDACTNAGVHGVHGFHNCCSRSLSKWVAHGRRRRRHGRCIKWRLADGSWCRLLQLDCVVRLECVLCP